MPLLVFTGRWQRKCTRWGSIQMSANPLEIFTVYAGAVNGRQAAAAFPSERRKRARIQVHWPVLLFRNEVADAIASTTQDLSSSGFYCRTTLPLSLGEALNCALKVPFHDPSGKLLDRSLECRVRVIRVETHSEGCFGIACHIEDYHFADFDLRGCHV